MAMDDDVARTILEFLYEKQADKREVRFLYQDIPGDLDSGLVDRYLRHMHEEGLIRFKGMLPGDRAIVLLKPDGLAYIGKTIR